jgi:hypothetical protein
MQPTWTITIRIIKVEFGMITQDLLVFRDPVSEWALVPVAYHH